MLDFNTAQEQKIVGGLIPDDTPCFVMVNVRAGGHGPGGWCKQTGNRDALVLDVEFTVSGGDFDKRKFWKEMFVEGNGSQGHETAVAITRGQLRAMLEGAYGIDPKDQSPAAMKARQVEGYNAFHLLRVPVIVGVEQGDLKDKTNPKGERFPDKNRPKLFLTPGHPDYASPGPQEPRPALQAIVAQPSAANQGGGSHAPSAGAGPGPVAPVAGKPSWAA